MVCIAITQAAFDAIARTLKLGSVGYEKKTNERGEKLIWLEAAVIDRLRGPARPRRKLQRPDFAEQLFFRFRRK
jgi:hypothetical protein